MLSPIKCYNSSKENCNLVMNLNIIYQIFCLVHKMDLIPKAQREMLFSKRKEELEHLSKPLKVRILDAS